MGIREGCPHGCPNDAPTIVRKGRACLCPKGLLYMGIREGCPNGLYNS
jgi:hypothetical protein